MKSVRLRFDRVFEDECGRKLTTYGTIALPAMYDGQTLRELQRITNQGLWVCGYKEMVMPKGDKSFDIVWSLIDIYEKLNWVFATKWLSPRLVIFQENSMHFQTTMDAACSQSNWFLYKPITTWKEFCPPQ